MLKFRGEGRRDKGKRTGCPSAACSWTMRALAALACSLAADCMVAGQTGQQPDKDEIVELESFQVTASRRPARILEVAEAVTLVDKARVMRESPGVLAETFRGQAGTFFQQTTPGQGIPIIRGLKGSEVLHLVDGMRLNNAFFRNAPNQYLGLVDAWAVDRLEVVRGSAPSLHGADAMGGVVQVLTAEPDFTGDSWHRRGRIYGSFNNVDDSFTTRADAAVGKAGSVLSGGITWQDFGDRRTGGGSVVLPTAYAVRAGDLKWRQDLSPAAELILSTQVLEQPSTPRIDELQAGFGQQYPNSAVYEFHPNRRSFLHARYRLYSSSRWFERLEIHAARQVITDDRLTQDFAHTVLTRESNSSTLDGLTLQFNTPWGAKSTSQKDLVWGWEYYTDAVSSHRVSTDEINGEAASVPARFPDRSGMESAAVYAANRWQSGRLTFEAGVRYSAFDIELPASGGAAGARLQPSDLTGDLHATWALKPGLSLVANVGRGFRPPNIFDLGTLGSRPGNRFNQPNPRLRPESVWSYDVGLKVVERHWQAELFVFYLDYSDKITSVLTGAVTQQGRFVVQSRNLNQARLSGFESGVRWQSGHGLEAHAVLNYTRGEEHDVLLGTVPADRVPPLNGRLGLVFAPGNGLRLQSWCDFAGRQDRLSPRDREDPRIAPGGTAAFATLNLLLSWENRSGDEIGMRLQNLTDRRYREHGSGIDAPGRNIGFWFNVVF